MCVFRSFFTLVIVIVSFRITRFEGEEARETKRNTKTTDARRRRSCKTSHNFPLKFSDPYRNNIFIMFDCELPHIVPMGFFSFFFFHTSGSEVSSNGFTAELTATRNASCFASRIRRSLPLSKLFVQISRTNFFRKDRR